MIQLALASAQGNNDCTVLLGDWNYFRKVGFGDALRRMPEIKTCQFNGEHRDFIVSLNASHEEVVDNQVLAWDCTHSAILAKIGALAPAQGNITASDSHRDEALAVMAQAEENQRAERERQALVQLEQDRLEAEEDQRQEAKRRRLKDEEGDLARMVSEKLEKHQELQRLQRGGGRSLAPAQSKG